MKLVESLHSGELHINVQARELLLRAFDQGEDFYLHPQEVSRWRTIVEAVRFANDKASVRVERVEFQALEEWEK